MNRRALLSGTAVFCALFVLFALLVPAAQEQKETSAPPAPRPEAEALRKAAGEPVDPSTYPIGAEDILFISVWRQADLSGTFLVRPDGKITMPLINDLQAAGLTPEKLAAVITEGISKFIVDPNVTVKVAQVNSKKYFVIGEVQRPGSYPLVVPTTILQAITIAGGLRDFANSKKITILRGPKRYKFNYKEVVRAQKMAQNILLENADQIIVP
jgi:polysaccharide export outer membrane protein